MSRRKGLFITFEGPDGSGKSSVINFLKKKVKEVYLNQHTEFLFTREPGGTTVGEKIREILLDNNIDMLPITEAFLFASSRAELFNGPLRKQLEEENKILISDRYVDSSIVYQGIGRGVGKDIVEKINFYATYGLTPDYTFFLDISPEESKNRIQKYRITADRLDKLNDETLQKIYESYNNALKKSGSQIIKIKASDSLENVCNNVFNKFKTIVDKHLKK